MSSVSVSSVSRRILERRPRPISSPAWAGTTIRVLQVVVATLGADDLKSEPLQGSDELFACNAGQAAHKDTVTRCTPTKRLVSTGLPSTSMQRAIAS